jgi:hypothetical protein
MLKYIQWELIMKGNRIELIQDIVPYCGFILDR